MSRPSLHDVLRKHKAAMSTQTTVKDTSSRSEIKTGKVKHMVIEPKDAKALFFDLPHSHKFWLVDGNEINNLTELYKSLVEMTNDVFRHHVSRRKNDFSIWVHDVLGDTVLSRRLKASYSKVEHVDIVKNRINQLKKLTRRLPHPKSNLDPDYSFIKVERARERVPRPTLGLERKFKIKGQSLIPDATFIVGAHPHGGGKPRPQDIIDTQRATIQTLEKEVEEKKFIEQDLQELINNYKDIYQHIAELRNQIKELKEDMSDQGLKQKEMDKEQIKKMKELMLRLKDKEREILAEIKHISKNEEKILSRTNSLMEKEKELAKKEGLVLKKEGDYNKLLKRYDDVLRNIKGRQLYDRKGSRLLAGSPKESNKNINKGLQVKADKKPMVQKVHKMHHQRLLHKEKHEQVESIQSSHHEKPKEPTLKKKKSLRERIRLAIIDTRKGSKDEKPVAEMLDDTMAGKDEIPDMKVIEGLLNSAKHELEKKDFDKAKKEIDEIKVILDESKLNNDYKRDVFYQIFEIETEIDLNRK